MEEWKGFGFDRGRANADISRNTGKWGKLKTAQEVHDYLQTMKPREIPTYKPTPDRAIAKPPAPQIHGLAAARIITMANGIASISKVNEYGIPTETLDTKNVESKANGRAFMCSGCDKRFATWPEIMDHMLSNRKNTAKKQENS